MKGEEEKERKGTYEGVNVARRVLGFDRYIALSLPQITHFFKLFWATLITLPKVVLNNPKNKKKNVVLVDIIKRGIIFCQIERVQISPQDNFWINFKYQLWKGAPPSFKIKKKKKKFIIALLLNVIKINLNSIIPLLNDWIIK